MRLCVLGGGGDLRLGQSGKRLYVRCGKRASLGGCEQLFLKRVFERRFFFVELFQLGLVGVGKVGARLHKLLIVILHQPQRFRIEVERCALVVDRFHARKKFRVQINRILLRGQARGFVRLHLLQLIVNVRAGDAVEHQHGPREQLAGALQRDDGVFKCGRRGIVGDGLDLIDLHRHTRIDGRLVIAVLDLVEGRRLKRQRAGRVKGIVRSESGGWRRHLRGSGSSPQNKRNSSRQNAPFHPIDMKLHHGDIGSS